VFAGSTLNKSQRTLRDEQAPACYCGDHPHHYGSYVAVAEADVIEFMDRISSTVALFFLS
jgi:hypothetical protein